LRRNLGLGLLGALVVLIILPEAAKAAPPSPPGTPTKVTATAGTLAATVSWKSPTSGGPVSLYTATSNPGSISATVAGNARSAVVTGLSYGVAYTFTVVATNDGGSGSPSAASKAVTPAPPGSQFHPVPAYVLFNSNVTAGHPAAAYFGEDPTSFPGLSAIAVNVTASQVTADTSAQLVVNNVVEQTIFVAAGQVVSSLAVVGVPASVMQAAIQVTTGSAHVELDSVGYYTGPTLFHDHGGLFQALTPAQLFKGGVGANSTTSIAVLGQGGVPASNVQAVLLNVTASAGAGAGSLSLKPSNATDHGTTSVGFAAGQTSANRVLVAMGPDGAISLLDRGAAVTALVEVLAWITSAADATATGAFYSPVMPARLLNATSLSDGRPLSFAVRGQGGTPSDTAVAPSTNAVLLVTVSSPSAASTVSLYPSTSLSGPAELVLVQGKTASALIVATLALDGSETIAISGASATVTVDLIGYYSGDLIIPGTTKRLPASLLAGITSLTDTGITFGAGVQASPPIQVNDVINGEVTSTTPNGFLLRVLTITHASTGETILTTRRATVGEALTSYSIDWTLPRSPGAFGFRAAAAGRTVAALPPFQPPPGTSIDPAWPVFTLVAPPNTLIYPTPTSFHGISGEVDLNDLELQFVPHFEFQGSPFNNPKFAAGLSVGLRFQATASVHGTIASQSWTLFDQTVKGAFFAIDAGPILIIGRPVVEISVTVDLTLQAGISVQLNLDKYGLVTAGYDNGFFGHFQGVDYIPDGHMAIPVPSLQVEFRPGLHMIPGVEFYGFLTIGADVNPYFRITADPFANPWWTVALGICLHIAMKIDLIIDKKEGTIDLACVDHQILAAPGNFIHITISPPSATVARGGSQHFAATTDNNTPHGVLWSLFKANGGTLSNVTVSSVDYTAPTRAGTYELDAAAVDDSTSIASALITVPADHPTAPTGLNAFAGPSSAVLTWTAPNDDGGANLVKYLITVTGPSGTTYVITPTAATSYVVIGLIPGNSYTFNVAAINAAGLTGAPSATTAPVVIRSAAGTEALPTSIDFGQVAFGQQAPPQIVTVFASSSQDVSITTITLSGSRPQDFTILNDHCTGVTISAGNACSFQVGYTANIQDFSRAFVLINDNDPASPQQSVQLSGFSPVPVTPGFQPTGDIQFIDSQHGFTVDLEGQVWGTTDGQTWSHITTPSGLSTNPTWQPLHFVDSKTGFGVAGSNLYSTTDGGATWTTRNTIPNIQVPTHVWFSDATHGWVDGYNPFIPVFFLYATTDGGQTWAQQSPQLPAGCTASSLNLTAIRFADNNNGWLLGNVQCSGAANTTDIAWTTSDGGTTWVDHPTGIANRLDVGRLQVIDGQHMRELYSNGSTVLLLTSNDGGTTFNSLSVDPSSADAVFTDASHGYIIAGTQVQVSTDGGLSWSPLGTVAPSTIALPASIGPGNAHYTLIAVIDATHWWVTGDYNSVHASAGLIVATSNGGSTWATQIAGDGTFLP
jgi:hypothetical protein